MGSIVLMLVSGTARFADNYFLIFLVFGVGCAAASVLCSAGLIVIKRK